MRFDYRKAIAVTKRVKSRAKHETAAVSWRRLESRNDGAERTVHCSGQVMLVAEKATLRGGE